MMCNLLNLYLECNFFKVVLTYSCTDLIFSNSLSRKLWDNNNNMRTIVCVISHNSNTFVWYSLSLFLLWRSVNGMFYLFKILP